MLSLLPKRKLGKLWGDKGVILQGHIATLSKNSPTLNRQMLAVGIMYSLPFLNKWWFVFKTEQRL